MAEGAALEAEKERVDRRLWAPTHLAGSRMGPQVLGVAHTPITQLFLSEWPLFLHQKE